MPQLGGFTVAFIDPDTNAQFDEYKTSTTSNTAECYIESKAEKLFGITIAFRTQHLEALNAHPLITIIVDGTTVYENVLRIGIDHASSFKILGAQTGVKELRSFVFGDTQFTGYCTAMFNVLTSYQKTVNLTRTSFPNSEVLSSRFIE